MNFKIMYLNLLMIPFFIFLPAYGGDKLACFSVYDDQDHFDLSKMKESDAYYPSMYSYDIWLVKKEIDKISEGIISINQKNQIEINGVQEKRNQNLVSFQNKLFSVEEISNICQILLKACQKNGTSYSVIGVKFNQKNLKEKAYRIFNKQKFGEIVFDHPVDAYNENGNFKGWNWGVTTCNHINRNEMDIDHLNNNWFKNYKGKNSKDDLNFELLDEKNYSDEMDQKRNYDIIEMTKQLQKDAKSNLYLNALFAMQDLCSNGKSTKILYDNIPSDVVETHHLLEWILFNSGSAMPLLIQNETLSPVQKKNVDFFKKYITAKVEEKQRKG